MCGLEFHFAVLLRNSAVCAEAWDLALSFEKQQQVLQCQSIPSAEKFLKLEADAEVLQRKHPFRFVVLLAHRRDVVEFASPTQRESQDVIKVEGILFRNRVPGGKADATVPLKNDCLFFGR